jgi:hypothetical protein
MNRNKHSSQFVLDLAFVSAEERFVHFMAGIAFERAGVDGHNST